MAANPGTVAVRVDGDKFVFVSLTGSNKFDDTAAYSYVKNTQGVVYTDANSEFHVLPDDKVKPFSIQNTDIKDFFDHHPEFNNFKDSLSLELQKFLTLAFEDMVLKDPRAFRDYKHMLIHLQATGDTEFTVTKIDTPVYIKTNNDVVGEAAGDEAIRKLASLNPNAIIFRDGASVYAVTPKGAVINKPQNTTFTVKYPDGTIITYPLRFFVSSSNFTLTLSTEDLNPTAASIEAFNNTRSATSIEIQGYIDDYVNSLPSDSIWLRNIYYNPSPLGV